ncbi:unnamed protein product [Psylliodes chrysocephalus]|uniref:U5 small nuclear ribonucleoprotein TSSC4 n=1 Tax=Psylliodes chrysocephalus TaxID=3402493 RepID=A0A9P0GK69_9CUCU|nr:unnamed protein product [Psylliodes chrysocephala]
MSKNDEFTLKSASADFNLRQKSVFDQLYALENDRHNTPRLNEVEVQMDVDDEEDTSPNISNPRSQRSMTKRLRGKESIFKKPQNPVPKNYINRIPDFKKHPHKWTRYTLDDVEDVSDKSNTKAALSFLQELNERKLVDNSFEEDKVDLSKKIVFKKQNKFEETRPTVLEDPEKVEAGFRSSKVIMPEYVVGQKVKKAKQKKSVNLGKELKLDHLYEDE